MNEDNVANEESPGMGVEIERKFTVKSLPDNLESYPYHVIEQGYLNVWPAIRVRREDDHFYMTYKWKTPESSPDIVMLGQPDTQGVNGAGETTIQGDKDAGETSYTQGDKDAGDNSYTQGNNVLDNQQDLQGGAIGKTEYNLPMDEASYNHLLSKADGNVIRKKRYLLPLNKNAFEEEALLQNNELKRAVDSGGIKIELDIFEAPFEGRIVAEIEFPSEEAARIYKPAGWFDCDVTGNPMYSNAHMSTEVL